ncbi:MAG TPA: type II toxin-antitoxin system VapC family toxin [Verrucomicrobiae bacterium]|jgi:PIN domain nuclease of toxin-antitoxin system|nr:type II toxin-antitoxin system VapC family toxin [Verrucomicrobiae bacterium]
MERSDVKYLLDTAPWANDVLNPEIVPARIKNLLDNMERKGLCSISLLECAILHRRGRLPVNSVLGDFFKRGLAADIEVLELTPEIAAVSNDLPENFHGDPFDRVIAATAKVLSLTLITCDAAIRDARFCKVEFYPFKPSRLTK